MSIVRRLRTEDSIKGDLIVKRYYSVLWLEYMQFLREYKPQIITFLDKYLEEKKQVGATVIITLPNPYDILKKLLSVSKKSVTIITSASREQGRKKRYMLCVSASDSCGNSYRFSICDNNNGRGCEVTRDAALPI